MKNIPVAWVFLIALTTAVSSAEYSQSVFQQDRQLIQKIKIAKKYYLRGQRHFLKKDFERSEKEIRKCLDIFPRFSDAAFVAAQIAYSRGELQSALEMMEKAEVDYRFIVKLTGSIQNEVKERQQEERRTLEEDMRYLQGQWVSQDAHCALLSALASARQRMSNFKSRAVASFDASPDIPAAYAFVHGNILFRLRDDEGAERQYLDTLRSNPRHQGAYNNLAGLYLRRRSYSSALDVANQALTQGVPIDPGLQDAILQAMDTPGADILEREFSGGVKQFMVDAGEKDNPFYANCYVVFNPATRDAIIIDPGARDERISRFIAERRLRVRKIFNTHGHSDHIRADRHFAELYHVSVAAPRADAHLYPKDILESIPVEWIKEDGPVPVEGFSVTALHIPGHSPGSLCFRIDQGLFTGDNLFRKGIGRVWEDTLKGWLDATGGVIRVIRDKLFSLPGELPVYPGHGLATSLGEEKRTNPFFSKTYLCELLKQALNSEKGIVSAALEEKPEASTDMHIVFSDSAALASFARRYGDSLLGLKLRLAAKID